MNHTVQGDGRPRHLRRASSFYSSAVAYPELTTHTKTDLRRNLRAQRTALSPAQQAQAARALDVHVAATRLFRVCRRIACYLPANGEIDPANVIERIWGLNKRCYLPVLSRLTHDRLWFAPATPGMALAPNRYGILEPVTHARNLVRAQELDLILMPVVGFDARGRRLGMGKGFLRPQPRISEPPATLAQTAYTGPRARLPARGRCRRTPGTFPCRAW